MKTIQSQDYWDIALAVFLIIISIVTLVGISNVRQFDYEPLGPTFLPKALSYCFFVMSGLIILKIVIRKSKEKDLEVITSDEISSGVDEEAFSPHPWLAVLAVGMISMFIGSMKYFGFRATSLVFMIVLGTILIRYERKSSKKRNLISLAIIAIILSFGLFYIFTELLGVRIP